ncbi:aldose epimerase family protein [Amantichitinum ursilacus]|uniref:Aldose 1-epimerase n=1 Tax=Amantichitinum ursilacus TaxID=857265 RepID=A0A0N0XJH4_9NEIS|nr:aldose epimerase family protein [Amantichitinum ursilacus]KPC52175.1 Aldose 1-epimerase [Amantichitinum ursilacus]
MPMLPIQSTPWDNGATLFTLRNSHDMRVVITDIGASLVSWFAPDRSGRMADVLLGHADAAGYLQGTGFFGSIAGRWANRIKGARCNIDGQEFELDANEGNNHLHGGFAGFHNQAWTAHVSPDSLRLSLLSPDGAGGFPGNLRIEVDYRLDDEGVLTIAYAAATDAPTPINLTNHAYFNLSGGEADIRDHILRLNADEFLAIDEQSIPVAHVPVAGSAFDFRTPAPMGARLAWPEEQLTLAKGFDHCYVVQGQAGSLREAASVYDPASGRELKVATTERGLQLYTGNYLEGVVGRRAWHNQDGVCLEAECFPNQINSEEAESVILRPGKIYRQTTTYQMTVRR